MSPMEIWCNESQERYVLGVREDGIDALRAACERERCPFAVVGEATADEHLVVTDRLLGQNPVDLPMSVLFGKPPKMTRTVTRGAVRHESLALRGITVAEAAERILTLPAVGSKKFLITIGDRSVGGLTARDQMVGPWQVPVSDVAVTSSSFGSTTGEAMSMGERTPLAIISSPAAARMAIGEAITNIAASSIAKLSDVKLSANWMAAVGVGHEDERLYDTVKAVGEDFCPALGLTIPVGKDSLSMRSVWDEDGAQKSVVGPLSLIISAFAPVQDVARTLTPQLVRDEDTVLILVDLSDGHARLGGSALAQVYNQIGDETPDVEAGTLKKFFEVMQKLNTLSKVLAYHDRSDGGLFAALAEMMFAGRCGVSVDIDTLPGKTVLEKLFTEELGVILQVRAKDTAAVCKQFGANATVIGKPTLVQQMVVTQGDEAVFSGSRAQLEKWWVDTSYRIQAIRDNADMAKQELTAIEDDGDPGLSPKVTFDLGHKTYSSKPKVAIFREEGVNGQVEMAAAFSRAGFTAVDVHLNDLLTGSVNLKDFVGLAACGGFSYGDVLGAGGGWAKTILFDAVLRAQFKEFFERPDTFSFGVCNGCQMLSNLKEIIPGAALWPTFQRNVSEQFEARVASVMVDESPSIMFKGMAGSVLPIPVAHGEGRAEFLDTTSLSRAKQQKLVALQYTDNYGKATETYPCNPNGSPEGITALTTTDGRATILMPHPERAFLTQQLSWHPDDWGVKSPWFKLFQNARMWVGE
jgi:phosphoribosylformylglycinamidine synthase